MPEQDERLLRKLMPIFREEAREHIAGMAARLPQLPTVAGVERTALIETVFREAHSLKAAARAVGQTAIERVCQSLESVFDALKRGEFEPSPDLVASLLQASDALEDFLAAIDAAPDPQRQVRASDVAKRLDALLGAMREGKKAPAPLPLPPLAPPPAASPSPAIPEPPKPAAPASPLQPPLPQPPPAPSWSAEPPQPAEAQPAAPAGPAVETVRLAIHRLDALMLQTEEMLAEKLAARQLAGQIRATIGSLNAWKAEFRHARTAIPAPSDLSQPASGAERQLRDLIDRSELFIRAIEERLTGIDRIAAADARGLGAKVDRLLYDMKQALTLPCGSLLQLFPRTVRELARGQGKEVALEMSGVEIEMDRHILEELKDPLLHLVRNCVDHGVEKPQTRVAAGKNRRATIRIDVATGESGNAEFIVRDDGAGISTRKLATAAAKLGLLPVEQVARAATDDKALQQLIFQSGVSTAPMITDLSGRGLGLAIVREKVERLGGRVTVQSAEGQGTIFHLSVPLTLATYRGILIRVGDRPFVLPTLGVERAVGVERTKLTTVENRPVLDAEGMSIPIVSLRDILELPEPPRAAQGSRLTAVVIGTQAGRVAFEVDAIEGDQEILVKPLGPYLVRVRNVQGATVLASGAIAPILNIHDLLKSAMRRARSAAPATAAGERDGETARILLVEDSITARGLLRNILEAAGYRVTIAVDGMDAWTTLNLEPFDLVVSDVEMPRMNGFELTERIRSLPTLKDLPVILVTALESAEDRERGADAGANAYITKGGFEQDRLLEAVRRLV